MVVYEEAASRALLARTRHGVQNFRVDTRPSPRPAEAQIAPGPLPQYDDNGVALSLIRANLRLTVEERARRAERQAPAP